MNENAKTWVAALRSGDYKQGIGRLTYVGEDNTMKHCCLGVACELYQREVGDLKISDDRLGIRTYDGHAALLPEKVADWLGIATDGLFYPKNMNGDSPEVADQLTARNDTGATFEMIASIVENEPSLF